MSLEGRAARIAGVGLVAALCVGLFLFAPFPEWLRPGVRVAKFAVIAVVVGLAVIGELEKRR